jgi:two-component system cell cycle sensor histidine kinase/response regulator CckA
LPCATTWQKDDAAATATPPPKETVLLVEPDDRLRSVTRTVLNRRGYRVIETDCAEVALTLWEGQGSQVSLLFTETMLPGQTSGLDLAAQLLSKKPDLRVLYTSNSDQSKAAPDFLPKPYIPEKLLETVNNRLTAPAVA